MLIEINFGNKYVSLYLYCTFGLSWIRKQWLNLKLERIFIKVKLWARVEIITYLIKSHELSRSKKDGVYALDKKTILKKKKLRNWSKSAQGNLALKNRVYSINLLNLRKHKRTGGFSMWRRYIQRLNFS